MIEMKKTLFLGLAISALVVSIGTIGLLNTPSADAEPNCDNAGREQNNAGNFRGNAHCIIDDQPVPSCNSPDALPCRIQGNVDDNDDG